MILCVFDSMLDLNNSKYGSEASGLLLKLRESLLPHTLPRQLYGLESSISSRIQLQNHPKSPKTQREPPHLKA